MESRRERQRAATVDEITRTARRILVEDGVAGVTLRAIAREMGMTAPGLYRYFGSHGELLRHLVAELFREITDELEKGMNALPNREIGPKFLTVGRVFREWCLAHPREFALLFGAPPPALDDEGPIDFADECGRQFAMTFMQLFLHLWEKHPFPVASDDELDPSLRAQLTRYRETVGIDLPLAVLQIFLNCWVRLEGVISMEVFGHLDFALDDAEPLFELTLRDLAEILHIPYTPRSR
ncbi:TetR/AcrR family transcriptional regulator [Actinomadura rayongensis]|uniref:TetR family transcriptional regulator n=1 Tax=Actinomadura rayongensis TaxID=1429076 RepID=A0A6I4W156_9ACTN|nr:TetR/AcrR family transcriptional regulator [Actinomadura rayongensis]MXQ63223.1 TetR family transcriptional regulator [Actinomadura rayongensis]